MNPRHHPDAVETAHGGHAAAARRDAAGRETVLVPFPDAGARRPRRSPRADERRGEILLFLGVRYERLAS